ncbi:subtilisin-like protease SBT1.8 [Ricinus communis]|uniref:Xylem serine proteinase 1, putative n=1 Tax=Ricinus communis TaxID=3988 RepID=B9RR97_RICCO|nr:subtilisin-like protease SBT1.8 [Ricinus communis]EEF46268.1 Xylem serine proteinase 1 precursor, putative [Ricinus communis]|eukprot:XP_002516266.1 subtilisin-like protease SBT1.8 [Ricinus communis]
MASVALTLLSLLFISITCSTTIAKQTYIVHMKHHTKPEAFATHQEWYSASLQSVTTTTSPSDSLLYSYSSAFPGFAASLDPEEADSLRKSNAVLDVYEDTVYSLHTTRTPEFLGLNTDLGLLGGHNSLDIDRASYSVVIGVLDTGVWPESKSFDDSGMPEIPSKWKGECESGSDFSPKLCNKKLIGARFFSKGYRMASAGSYLKKSKEIESPRDQEGHGTHTASTAAGSQVVNASLLGYASGNARGMATHARVSSYKVCWSTGCYASDILAGMDKAIADGVDVLSLSLGGGSAPYYRDTIAVGAFAAVERGIFVSCSAGNSGPSKATLANVAPWIMTVGAGTLDRDFPAYAVLGNQNRFTGVSLYSGTGMGNKPVGLVYNKGNSSSNLCLPGSLVPSIVRGKVVVCDRGINPRVEKGAVVRDAGGIGMILANTAASGEELVADSHLLPAVAVGSKAGDMIREYMKGSRNPTALLSFGGTVLNVRPSPVVAAFSSRGPNMVTPQILKPDLIGPGVNILAAWSEAVGPTGLEKDTRKTQFNIMSGTSMSCPHISGVAALLKAARPGWSPSAIKSALMTTAYVVDNTHAPLRDAGSTTIPGTLSNPWAHGSGHVDPHKAMSPGLVYDVSTEDYVAFLCSLGYTIDHVQLIVKRPNVTCARKFSDPGELNYPSFSVVFGNKRVVRYTRELTNVGEAGSIYEVEVTAPSTVGVSVKPTKLVFRNVGDKLRYTVTFVAKKGIRKAARNGFGSIVWRNAEHQVRSPVAFAWTQLL